MIAGTHQNFFEGLPIKASHRPGGSLTQTVKQSYGVCFLTGHMFKGVQTGDVKHQ